MTDICFAVMGDGCRIAYRFDGPAEAPMLLLSNSLGTDMSMWAPQIDALRGSFRILRYDGRGHGASDVPAGAYSIDRLGRDVIELMDALGISRAHFCGLSLGGMIGQWLGWREPGRLNRLIIANSSSFMGPAEAWDQRIVAIRQRGMVAIADAVMERWFTDDFRQLAHDVLSQSRDILTGTNVDGYAGCCAAIRDMDQRHALALINAPTLVIGGLLDPATPMDHTDKLYTAIPNAKRAVLKAAHLSNLECPSEFTSALKKFLLPDPQGLPTP